MKTVLIKINTLYKPLFGKNRYVAGIGRSTMGLLDALAEKDSLPFKIKLYGTALRSIGYTSKHYPYTRLILPQSIITKTGLETLLVNRIIKNDLFHIPHNTDEIMRSRDFIVTIHDTCEYDLLANGRESVISLWKYSAEKSRSIITCSECSKWDIVDRFKVNENKITVIPWGVDTNSFRILGNDKVRKGVERMGIKSPYLLSVSCSNVRKNMANLMRAFREFRKVNNTVALVLLWSNPSVEILNTYQEEIREKRIIFLDHVSDEDLVVLYNGALATMYPSRYEGFGFPILESFACGTPVMTCKNSSLSELGSDIAHYIGEDDIDGMASTMALLTDEHYAYNEFLAKASEHVKKYSWSRTADQYIDFYSNQLY